MKTLIILMLLLSLGACKKSKDSGSSKNPTPPPNNPTPEPPEPPPTINEITSVQKIYGSDSEVEFVVTFSHAVKVSEGDSPFLALTVEDQPRQAHFDRGSEGSQKGVRLFFIYEVQPNDNDSDGVSLAKLSIDLNGGSIKDDAGQDVTNIIPEKYQNFPNVKVDTLHPTISSVATVSSATLFGPDAIVDLVATFNEPVKINGVPSLTLSVGGSPASADYQDKGESYSLTHTFRYTVSNGHSGPIQVTGLSVNSSNSINDGAENPTAENIQTPLSVSGVTVDTIHPTISSVATVSSSTPFGPDDIVDLMATFNEPVKITGVPNLILSVGGSPASANYQDKGESYSLTHTFRYTVSNGHRGPIQVTGLSVDSSNSISDGAENPTAENIQAPLSVSGVTVEARSCDYTVTSGFNGGSGSESSPYLICTYAQLNKMRENLMAHYELGQDINANPSWSAGDNGCTAYDGSTVPTTTPCTGWASVGTFEDDKCDGGTDDVCFQGHFDGGDHVISNLYLNISASGQTFGGLFGYTGSQAEISHIGLTNSSVTVTSSASYSYSYGGGLVGYNYQGTVSNSYATGEVTASSGYISYGGGLVGYNYRGTVSNSYATGEMTSSDSAAYSYGGGLVGYNYQGTVSNSYATGEVTTTTSADASHSYGGGLVGYGNGTISNSYATGEVTTTASADASYSYGGGLVGRSSGGTISNSYATGEVTSSASYSAYGGGLVGRCSGTISNSYATGEVTSSASSSSHYSYSGGLVGRSSGTISNSYATGDVTPTSSNFYGGGLVGYDYSGTISGTNYFVDSSGTNGLGSGTCSGTTCTQKPLVELQALTSVTDWSTDNWGFGTTTQLPRVKYAPTATYCTDDTHTTQQACEDASESWVIEGCGGDTGVVCGDVIPGQ